MAAEFSGAQPFDAFKAVIDGELAKAKTLVTDGVAKDKVYRVLVAENFKKHVEEEDDDEGEKEDTTTVWKVPVTGSPVRGKADASGHHRRVLGPPVPLLQEGRADDGRVRKTYGDKVRIVWKDMPLPFHPRAMPAAEVARAARAAKGGRRLLGRARQALRVAAQARRRRSRSRRQERGLDVAKVMGAVKGQTYKKGIEADMTVGDDIQANGTPHFFVNGRRLVGAQPVEKFKTIIDDELKKFDAQKGKVAAKDYIRQPHEERRRARPSRRGRSRPRRPPMLPSWARRTARSSSSSGATSSARSARASSPRSTSS